MRIVAAITIALAVYFSGHVAYAEELAQADVLIKVEKTVQIKNVRKHEHGICSGVHLGDGVILTAKHCVTDIDSLTVVLDREGMEFGKFPAQVIAMNKQADVALLRVETDVPAKSAELACRKPVIGEPIEMIGNPLGQTFIHTWGHVAGVMRDDPDPKSGDTKLIPVDIEIASGNSGGPAYDKDGKVLGLADIVIEGLSGGGAGQVRFLVSSLAVCGAAVAVAPGGGTGGGPAAAN